MPTLCLFLLPPSPAHPGALYLANSRTGCASIHRSRAGQDPQAHCPPSSHPPFPSICTAQPALCCHHSAVTLFLSIVVAACKTPSVCATSVPPCLFDFVSLNNCSSGSQVKMAFHGCSEQCKAAIKQWPDPSKHTHTHTLTQARRPSKKPGNLGFPRVRVTGFDDCS